MSETSGHLPVLLDEVLSVLAPAPGVGILVCQLGRWGQAQAMAHAADACTMVGMDLDQENLDWSRQHLQDAGVTVHTIHENFVRGPESMQNLGLQANIVLADLGFASNQVDDPSRGLSFLHDGPLDMRLDRQGPVTAASLIASLPERDLAELIRRHGEEPLANRIARKVALERARRPIETTSRLADIVREAYGVRARTSRQHPATRTFQALRIAVNDELAALDTLLDRLTRAMHQGDHAWLAPAARVGIISFHSLEDRPVKRCFADLIARGLAEDLTRGAVQAGEIEVSRNTRSRSARLRAIRATS